MTRSLEPGQEILLQDLEQEAHGLGSGEGVDDVPPPPSVSGVGPFPDQIRTNLVRSDTSCPLLSTVWGWGGGIRSPI